MKMGDSPSSGGQEAHEDGSPASCLSREEGVVVGVVGLLHVNGMIKLWEEGVRCVMIQTSKFLQRTRIRNTPMP
jgi:hypothetical protein